MKAIKVFIAAACCSFAASAAHAEACKALSKTASGERQITSLTVELAQSRRLDPRALPEGASAVACPRSSIVPLPNDVRVLTEWGVAFGIIEEGPRALWISANDGRLQTTVEHGELSAGENAKLNDWLKSAQGRFDDALSFR